MPEGSSGSPFTVDLAAGESLGFVDLMIDTGASGDFVGQVVVDVTIDDRDLPFSLDDGYLQVGEPDVTTVYALAGYGRLFCLPDPETYWHLVAGAPSSSSSRTSAPPGARGHGGAGGRLRGTVPRGTAAPARGRSRGGRSQPWWPRGGRTTVEVMDTTTPKPRKVPRVLILGGGTVGLYTARRLRKQLGRRDAAIVVVDPRPYMTYAPFLPEVAAGSIDPGTRWLRTGSRCPASTRCRARSAGSSTPPGGSRSRRRRATRTG